MKQGSFAKELKNWRGERLQKEVADLLGMSLRTYEGWEIGHNPSRFAKNEIRRLMAQHPEKKTLAP